MANLAEKLTQIISGLQNKEIRSKQATIDIHIETLNNIIRNDHVSIRMIVETINEHEHLHLNINGFKLMLSRARKSVKQQSKNIK
ncbi:hypothetical protein [Photobacterium indicum]|uniref:hypothetical protein n=1 Tax=Photobacterium indicum TaxID=81447 RepID=UPI003D13C0EF